MNNRYSILLISAAAALAIIVLVVVVYLAGPSDDAPAAAAESGSLLRPHVQRDARDRYVIAELYQDIRLDIRSGVYDDDGMLLGHHWSHDDVRHTCSIDLVLAMQEGMDQASPTATPRPTHTPLPTDAPRNPERYEIVECTVETDNGAGVALALLPTPRAQWPTSTPRPTYTPWPTPTPSPLISSVSWIGWENRPIAIEADGVARLDVPRDADVSANLTIWTGYHPAGQSRLATLPLPDAKWYQGTARIHLQAASGRILLDRDHIDTQHRSVRLSIQAGPLAGCHVLRLRWEKPAAVVVKALTNQPYADWRDHRLPPTSVPAPATLSGLTLTGMTVSPAFNPTTTTYTAPVPFATSETAVRPRLADPTETYVIRSGGTQLTENAPALLQLSPGANTITIEVSTADGNTTTTYTVTVSRETPSTDASLASLTLGGISPDQWTPPFDAGVYEYDVRVPHATARISVLPATTHSAATFAVATNPADALTDTGYGTTVVELAEGAATTITITVTAEDGSTTQDYVVRVHRAGP